MVGGSGAKRRGRDANRVMDTEIKGSEARRELLMRSTESQARGRKKCDTIDKI